MNLVVDVGNSLIKVSIFENEKLIKNEVFTDEHFDFNSFDELAKIDNAIISSVRKEKLIDISSLKDVKNVIEFSVDTPTPLELIYDTPESLGTDRIAAAVGGATLFPGQNVLSIVSGTCITYEFVNSVNKYYGGAISPGLMMRFKALNNFTAKLPLINNPALPKSFIGNSTDESILSGVFFGIKNEIDGAIDQYIKEYKNLKVVFSGGDAFYFDRLLKNEIFVTPNLVSYGLNKILLYNVQKHS